MNQNGKKKLYIITIILAITSIAFRIINEIKLEQTSLLFIGIPTLLSILVIKYVDTKKSLYGIAFYTVTLFLLLSAILLGEGIVCIIFMAPIFYGITTIIVFIISFLKAKNKDKLNSFVLLPILVILSQFNFLNKEPENISIKTTIKKETKLSINQINKYPDFNTNLPTFFKIGFPKPISIDGTGTELNDFRKIVFKSNTKGNGTLHLQIVNKTSNSITFDVIKNTTHIAHWLTFKKIHVKINSDNSVTWTTDFTCDLGPKWYFKPFEEYAVNLMNEHLINTFFN